MADFVASAEFQDNMTAGVNAATASLNKFADAGDQVDVTLARAGRSADQWGQRLIPAEQLANKLATAQRNLASVTAAFDAEVAKAAPGTDAYTAAVARRNTAVDAAAVKVQALTASTANAGPATDALAAAHGRAATAADRASGANAGITRELIVMGHETLMGNYTRIPGSMMVLAERSETAQAAIHTLGGMLMTTGGAMAGLGVAAVAVGGYLIYQALAANDAFETLNKTLAVSRADYASMATSATAAAHAVGAVGGGSKADTLAAAGAIGAIGSFGGNQADLQSLLNLTGRLAVAMGTDLAAATKVVTAALKDPEAEAKALADQGFRYLDDATVTLITHLENSGDIAKAQALIMDRLALSVNPVADAYKNLASQIDAAHEADMTKWNGGATGVVGSPQVLTNPTSGALGMMQVMPDTNADGTAGNTRYGYNLTTLEGNLAAGMTDWLTKLQQANGDIDTALKNYGGFVNKDPSGYIASVKGQDISQLSPDVRAAMSRVADRLPGGNAIDLDMIQKLALQESHGQQYGSQPITSAFQAPQFGPATPTADQLRASQVAQYGVDATLRATAGIKPAAGVQDAQQGQDLLDTLERLQKAEALTVEGSADFEKLQSRIDATRAAYEKWQNPLNTTIDKLNAEAAALLTGAAAEENGRVAALRSTAAAQAASEASGKYTGDLDTLTNAILNKNAAQEADKGAKIVSDLHDQALAAAELAHATAGSPVDQYYAALDDKIRKTTISLQASADATTDPKIRAALLDEISQVDVLTRSTAALGAQAKSNLSEAEQRQQLGYLQEETATLGESADIRARDLAVLREKQKIETNEPGLLQAEIDKRLANAGAIADATTQLQHQQQAIADIGNMMTQAFDQVGSAITQAFVNGNGAAVNWGNVTRAVIASVLQELLKLAVINPIMNAALGTNSTTLGSAVSALGGTSGGSSGSSGLGDLSSMLGLAGTANSLTGGSISSALGLNGIGSSISDYLGLGGVSLSGVLGTSLIAPSAVPVATMMSADSLAGAYGGAVAGGASGMTIGTLLGGVGAGFGAGSLAGGFIQSALGKTGYAPEIGAGGGALAGAAIGSIIPGIGTLIGGLIGGLLGGSGGGLIGPHPESAYSSTAIGLSNGLLSVGGSASQKDSSNAASTASDANTINAFLSAHGLSITSLGNTWQVGQNTPGGYADPGKAADLSSAFGAFRFASNDNTLNAYINGKSFDLSGLETAVTTYENLVNTTIPALTKQSTVTGSLNDAITQINTVYGAAITTAQQYGVATDSLAASQAKATAAATAAANAQTTASDVSLTSRYLSASATISGNPADALNAQLYAFDQAAPGQRDALKAQLDAAYGTAWETSQGYADQMVLLEKTLGQERLAIQQQYNDKLTATADQGVTSLASYVLKLQTGSASPLSPQAQYDMASKQFNAVAGSAAAGDWNSYTSLSGYADTLLSASKAYNGSGTAYTSDFNRVLGALSSLSTVTPDTLTASIYAAETRTQTQQLVDALASVRSEVAALRLEVFQGSTMPARVAAA